MCLSGSCPRCCGYELSLPFFFFFNDTATTEIYTLSLHDALPIFDQEPPGFPASLDDSLVGVPDEDRKSTRLNSSHGSSSYAGFCLKKKKKGRGRVAGEREKEKEGGENRRKRDE